jgi:hypothetical protein
MALAVAGGKVSAAQLFLPVLLIGFYAFRGYQLFRGDPAAAKRLLWLHGAGAAVAILQIATGGVVLIVLQSMKLVIHLFGGIGAYLAHREIAAGRGPKMIY